MQLTDKQKLDILKEWDSRSDQNPPSIEELLKIAYPDKQFDGRSKEGRLIKEFLIEKNLKATTKTVYIKKGLLKLTDEQQEYIRNNANMKAYEIARALWDDNSLSNTSQEARSVYAFQRELVKQGILLSQRNDEISLKNYVPPKTIEKTCQKINKYIKEVSFDFSTLKPTQKKQINSVIAYLNTYRFIYQMNEFGKQKDRELFESTYLSYVYDKPDLTREDLDKTVILATEAVISASKLKTIEMLEHEQERQMDENEGRMNMALVDAIKTATDEYNSSVKRQQALYNDLTKKRSDRLKDKLSGTANILNLIEMWKNEETRVKMIKLGEKRKEKLKEEIDRLSTMEDMICMVSGIDVNEVLNG